MEGDVGAAISADKRPDDRSGGRPDAGSLCSGRRGRRFGDAPREGHTQKEAPVTAKGAHSSAPRVHWSIWLALTPAGTLRSLFEEWYRGLANDSVDSAAHAVAAWIPHNRSCSRRIADQLPELRDAVYRRDQGVSGEADAWLVTQDRPHLFRGVRGMVVVTHGVRPLTTAPRTNPYLDIQIQGFVGWLNLLQP